MNQTLKARILQPAIREGWLRGMPGQLSGNRGGDAFIQVDWDIAIDLLNREFERIRSAGNAIELGMSSTDSNIGSNHLRNQLKSILLRKRIQIQTHDYCPPEGIQTMLLRHSHPKNIESFLTPVSDESFRTSGLVLNIGMRSTGLIANADKSKVVHDERNFIVDVSPVCPDQNCAWWIAIRPATESAFLMAICTELERYGLAPEFANKSKRQTSGGLLQYLLKGRDGKAFDADWAQDVCGINAEKIRELAARMMTSLVFINIGHSATHSASGEQTCKAALQLLEILRNVLERQVILKFGSFERPLSFDHSKPCITRSIPTRTSNVYNQNKWLRMGIYADVHILKIQSDINQLLKHWEALDTILVLSEEWTATSRHADIVLPVITDQKSTEIFNTDSSHEAKYYSDFLQVLAVKLRLDKVSRYLSEPNYITSPNSSEFDGASVRKHENIFPVWEKGIEWLGSPLSRRYPLHLIRSVKAEVAPGRAVAWMHPEDAEIRGIVENDTIRIWSRRGACLAEVRVCSHRLVNTLEFLPANEFEPITAGTPDVLDIAGSVQILLINNPYVFPGWDCLVEVSVWRLDPPPLRNSAEPRFAIEKLSSV